MEEIISQIPAWGPPSGAAEEVFRLWRAGEVSFDEYLKTTAMVVADKAHELSPERYSPIPTPVAQYIEQRRTGMIDPDRRLGMMLGRWVFDLHARAARNEATLSNLHWARTQVLEITSAARKLDSAIACFEGNFLPDGLSDALYVQRRDAAETRA